MLDELAARLEADGCWALTITDLATPLKLTERRARVVARSLEARGLVIITNEHIDWRGQGEYGNLEKKHRDDTAPTALLVKKGERWPRRRAFRDEVDPETWTALKDTEFIRAGVPTSGLLIWLPEGRRRWRAGKVEGAKQLCAMLRPGNPPTETELIEHYGPEL